MPTKARGNQICVGEAVVTVLDLIERDEAAAVRVALIKEPAHLLACRAQRLNVAGAFLIAHL
jgi:hypothetical protein